MNTNKGGKHRQGSLYRRGEVYWLKYMVEGRMLYQSLQTGDLKEAEQKRGELMRPIMAGSRADALTLLTARLQDAQTEAQSANEERNPPLSIPDAWTAFVKSPKRPDSGAKTLQAYEYQWTAFAVWLQHKHPELRCLREVNQDIADEYASELTARHITPNTFNKIIRVCALVFRVLKEKAKIGANPFINPKHGGTGGIQRKRQKTQHHRELTTEELIKVCQSAEGELRSMLAMGLYLGTRLGDAALMDWGAVDMLKSLIRYKPNKTARFSDTFLTVPLHPVLRDIFSETPPDKRAGYIHKTMAELYTKRGAYAVSNIVRRHFEKCGITTTVKGNGVHDIPVASFHSLRHSAVSLLREAGVPLSTTMAIVGHSTVAMHDTYTHVGEAAIKAAVASMPSVIGEHRAPLALPPPADDIRAKVKELIAGMTGRNWKTVRKDVLEILA